MPMQCVECGSEVLDSTTMCPACGAQAEGSGSQRGGSKEQSFLSRHLERALLVCGLMALAIGSWTIFSIHRWQGVQSNIPSEALSPLASVWPDFLYMLRQKPIFFAGQPPDHANPFVIVLLALICITIVTTIITALRGRLPFIRRIPGLNAIDEAVGRATEMGRPILFSGGLGAIGIVSLQALAIAKHVAHSAARFGSRLIVPVCDQTMLPITEQVMREAYNVEGKGDAFKPDDIRYLSDRQFAYAAGVTGILHREKVAASFLFGQFFAESLILAENGQAVGAIQVAGTPDLLQIPFFVVTCDYTIIGDEYYAATAYLSREPTQLGSLVGQDLAKVLLLAIIVVGIMWSVFTPDNPFYYWLGGQPH